MHFSLVVVANHCSRTVMSLMALPTASGTDGPSTSSTKRTFISRVFNLSKRGTENAAAPIGKGPLGLSTLYVPCLEQTPVADIIFVHGLNGGSHSTWSKGNITENFWPQKWLPGDDAFEQARIHTFGYPSGVTRESVLNIRDIARSLLAAIKDSPVMNKGRQPLILVAHSMGGLVVKMAYILGHHEQEFKPVVDRVCSIFFLATPHQGASIAQVLARLTAVIGVRPFIEDLFPQSPLIQAVSEEFPRVSGHLQLFSFYETRPMTVGVNSLLIVQKSSAVMNLANERQTFLDADHRGVAMYSTPNDPSYVAVKNALATVITSQRDSSESLAQASAHQDLDALSRFLGVSDAPENDIITHESVKLSGSCEWLVSKPYYRSWKGSMDSSFLWLRGRPGAGKSVLSSHIVGDLRSQGLDSCFFFFQERDIAKSTASSCLRSIAWQLASLHPAVLDKLKAIMSKWEGDSVDKMESDYVWRRLFLSGILKVKLDRPQFWIIDAMDECQGPDMVTFLTRIQERWPLSVLVTSRDVMPDAHQRGAVHKSDARSYTISEQDSLQDISLLLKTNAAYFPCPMSDKWPTPKEMASQILERSEGCFLWASIICSELGLVTSEREITQVMESTPSDMDALYRGILAKMETARFGKAAAKAFIAWTGHAFRPLSVVEIREAIEADINDKIGDVQRAISKCCGNLVYVDQHEKVQLVHATAREFFTREGDESEFTVKRADGHRRLAIVCLRILSQDLQKPINRTGRLGSESDIQVGHIRPRSLQSQSPSSTPSASPLTDYAAKFMFQHLNYAPSNDEELLAMLSRFLGSSSLLRWIEFSASNNDLGTVYQAGKTIKALLSRRTQQPPLIGLGLLEKWGDDLIYLVTRFSAQLRYSPKAIHHLIPPFCPPDSAIWRQFTNPTRGLNVHGPPPSGWDDSLTTISYATGTGTKPNVVAAGPGYFAVGMFSEEGQVLVYDDTIFQELHALCHGEPVWRLTFAKSGRYLASAGFNTVRVWSSADGSALSCFKVPGLCLDFGFTDDDYILRVATKRCELIEWDIELQAFIRDEPVNLEAELPETMQGPWEEPMFGKLGGTNLLAVTYKGYDFVLWDCAGNKLYDMYEKGGSTRTFDTHQLADDRSTVRAAAFSNAHGTSLLAAYYSDGDLVLFDLERGNVIAVAEGAYTDVMASCHDGRVLACADSRSLSLFDFETLRLLYRVPFGGIRGLHSGFAFMSDGLRFVEIINNQCLVRELAGLLRTDSMYDGNNSDTAGPQETDHLVESGKALEIWAIACCRESSVVFCAMEDGSVFAHDISGPEPDKQPMFVHGFGTGICFLHFEDQGSILACGDNRQRFTARRVSRRRHKGDSPRHKWGWEVDQPLIDARAAHGPMDWLNQILVSSKHGRILVSTENHDTLWPMPKQDEGTWIHQIKGGPGAIFGPPWVTRPGCGSDLLFRIQSIPQSVTEVYDWVTLTLIRVVPVPLPLGRGFQCLDPCPTNALFHPQYFAINIMLKEKPFGDIERSKSTVLWDYDSIEDGSASHILAPRGDLRDLPYRVERLIGFFRARLVLCMADHWIASVELTPPGSPGAFVEGSFVRHFFLPDDWFLARRDAQFDSLFFGIGIGGEIVLACRGELAVIKRGLEVTEDGAAFDPRRVSDFQARREGGMMAS